MANTLFDFMDDPEQLLVQSHRPLELNTNGTINAATRHSVLNTPSPDATMHHAIVSACPHPDRKRAANKEFYMLAYVSIPIDWLDFLDDDFCNTWDVSFIGPAGSIQKIPGTLQVVNDLLGEKAYIGFDWLWITAKNNPPVPQPKSAKIYDLLMKFLIALKERAV